MQCVLLFLYNDEWLPGFSSITSVVLKHYSTPIQKYPSMKGDFINTNRL